MTKAPCTDVFERFTAGREGTLWNYGEMLAVYRKRTSPRLAPLIERLERAVAALTEAGS